MRDIDKNCQKKIWTKIFQNNTNVNLENIWIAFQIQKQFTVERDLLLY